MVPQLLQELKNECQEGVSTGTIKSFWRGCLLIASTSEQTSQTNLDQSDCTSFIKSFIRLFLCHWTTSIDFLNLTKTFTTDFTRNSNIDTRCLHYFVSCLSKNMFTDGVESRAVQNRSFSNFPKIERLCWLRTLPKKCMDKSCTELTLTRKTCFVCRKVVHMVCGFDSRRFKSGLAKFSAEDVYRKVCSAKCNDRLLELDNADEADDDME